MQATTDWSKTVRVEVRGDDVVAVDEVLPVGVRMRDMEIIDGELRLVRSSPCFVDGLGR